MYSNVWILMICCIAISIGHQDPQSSGNDYHCNPSFHFHPYNRNDRFPVYESSTPVCQSTALPKDCSEVRDRGYTDSGQYMISPQDDGPSFRVYCDMDTDGGSWLVIQLREDGSVGFYRNWSDYQEGFGNTNSEHWLGNEKIHRITAQDHYQLRIDMADFDGNSSYAKYNNFRVGDFTTDYKLILGAYSGTAGDALAHHRGSSFSTKDRDNDNRSGNCALAYKGAWWYNDCHVSNLNGQYLEGAHESFADGVNWQTWKGYNYSLKRVEMKIKVKTS